MEVDLAIVGAGPAGSTLAALLAGRGVSVALYDRDVFPRDKLCGEFLSYDAVPVLEPLGVIAEIERAGAPRIERCRIVGSARTYEFPLPRAARGVSRLLFDDLLVRTAERSGAKRCDGVTVTDIRALNAKVIAGAWGRWGRFDQQLERAFVRDRTHRNFGFKRHYRGQHAADTIELYSFARGYLGVNAVENGVTNICGLVHASRLRERPSPGPSLRSGPPSPREAGRGAEARARRSPWDVFIETIRAEEAPLDALYARYVPAQENYLSSEPVIFRARSAVEGGVFMVGDASGIIDPLTGNGMAMAVQSALLAAPHILRLLESPDRREEIEDEYRRQHRALFAPRIAWSRRVAWLLSRPRLLDSALRLTQNDKIGICVTRNTRARDDSIERLAAAWFC